MKGTATATLEPEPAPAGISEWKTLEGPAHGSVGFVSVVGEVREDNQDSVLVFPVPANGPGIRRALLVADGAGGCHGGSQASRQAVLAVRALLGSLPTLFPPAEPDSNGSAGGWDGRSLEALGRWLGHSVDGNLLALRASDPSLREMATTMTLVLEVAPEEPGGPQRVLVVHIGDSRAYLMGSDGTLEQITRDHSKAAILRERGSLSDAINVLWGCLPGNGVEEYLQVLVRDLPAGGTVLVCSDGLWGLVPGDDIATFLTWEPDLQKAAEGLAELANHNGGHDNITVILARMAADPTSPAPAGDDLPHDVGPGPAQNERE